MATVQPTDPKPFWQSKTFWTNVAVPMVIPFLPHSISQHITPERLAAGMGVLNVLLRFITKQPMVLK